MTLDDWIKGHEGLRLKPYKDSRGNVTIGYGLNLENGITPSEAQFLYESRKTVAIRDATATVGLDAWSAIDDFRKCALVDLAYNLGEFELAGFHKMIACVRVHDWQGAADNLLMKNPPDPEPTAYADELPTRAHRDAELLRTGNFPA